MIRLATKEDVDIILRLNKEGLGDFKWSYSRKYITRSISRGNYYVICRKNDIIGAIKFYFCSHFLRINTLVVFNSYRGKGYAKKLMKFAIEIAKIKGYNRIQLASLTRSGVGGFYEKLGYEVVDEGPYYGREYTIYEKRLK
jgi:GNAT superfamily N-acetyltransferase